MGRRIAYRRLSVVDRETDRQLDGMTFDKVFEDKIDGKHLDRPELNKMLHYIRPNQGDHVYVYEMSALGNLLVDLYQIIDVIRKKGASVTFIQEQITFDPDHNTKEPEKTVFGMMSVLDKFEHSLMMEQQKKSVDLTSALSKDYPRRVEKLNFSS